MALKHVKTSSLDVIAAEVIGIKVHVSDECIFDTIEEAAEVYNVNPTIVRIKEERFIIKYLPLRKAGDNPRSTANKLLRMCDEYLDDLLESTSSISVVDLSISSSSTEILSSHSSLSSTESSVTSISSNSSISISSNSSDSTFTSNTSITSNSSDSYSSHSTSSYSSSSTSSDSSDS